jgi:hypothetical protein
MAAGFLLTIARVLAYNPSVKVKTQPDLKRAGKNFSRSILEKPPVAQLTPERPEASNLFPQKGADSWLVSRHP